MTFPSDELLALVDELVGLVEERADLYSRLDVVDQRIAVLRKQLGDRVENIRPPEVAVAGPPKARALTESRAVDKKNGSPRAVPQPSAKQRKLHATMEWLADQVKHGPRKWSDLVELAKRERVASKYMLTRARRGLSLCHGRRRYQGEVWVWPAGTESGGMRDENKEHIRAGGTPRSSAATRF